MRIIASMSCHVSWLRGFVVNFGVMLRGFSWPMTSLVTRFGDRSERYVSAKIIKCIEEGIYRFSKDLAWLTAWE